MTPHGWKIEELRRILERARREFDEAKAAFQKELEGAGSLGGFNHPDGATATRRAIEHYNFYLSRYHTALHDYSEFVLASSPDPKRAD